MNLTNNWAFRSGAVLLAASLLPQVGAQTLNGAGSTFPAPIYAKWFAAYRKANPDVKISYQAIGSGAGIQKISEGSVDFGATDDPMTDEQLKAAKDKRGVDIIHFPSVMGAIVPIYNVPGVHEDLNFTPQILADIFLGKIKRWDDPQLVKINPGIHLRPDPIQVVRRQDAAGSTYIWTEFLSVHSNEWKAGPGKGMTVKWPAGSIAGKGDEGVVGLVENTWDSIGYVEVAYALQEHLPYGKIQNSAGAFIKATPESIAAASTSLHAVGADLRLSISNAPGRAAYPLSSFTWLLVPSKMKDAGKQKAMASFLKWMLTEGQKSAEELSYARLPEIVVKAELERVEKLGQ